jgi:hypothetical protein
VLDDFDDKLNLTHDEKDNNKDDFDPILEKEYMDILKNMQKEGFANAGENMDQFSDLMSNILKGLGIINAFYIFTYKFYIIIYLEFK